MWVILINSAAYCQGSREQITLAYDVNTLKEMEFRKKYVCDSVTYIALHAQYAIRIPKKATVRLACINKSKKL